MKKKACTLFCALLFASLAVAQLPPPPPPPSPEEGRRPLERWMDDLRTHNPAEYDRLHELRRNDPEAFKEQLKKRLRHRKQMLQMKDMPCLHALLTNLPPEKRSMILEEFCRDEGQGGAYRGPEKFRPFADQTLEQEAVDLAEQYRATDDPAEKARLEQTIRAKLEESFDRRQEQRQQMMENMRRKLTELERQIANRQALRDKIIDRRTRELIDGELPEW